MTCPKLEIITMKECQNIIRSRMIDCWQLQEIDLTKSSIDSDFIKTLGNANNNLKKLILR